jgi:hypothetical protein
MNMRRARPLLLRLVLFGLVVGIPFGPLVPGATAQGGPTVVMTLSSQTPFATPKAPDVSFEVLVRNDGAQALENLSLRATLWPQVTTLGAYESSLQADPGGTAVASPAQPVDGTLQPGQTRRFRFEFHMPTPGGVSTTQSYVYPLKLELFSGGTSAAALRSSVVFVVRPPQTPVAFSTRIALEAPLLVNAHGVFESDELERAIASGGRIDAAVAAIREDLAADPAAPIDLVLSPVLLLELERMRQGYQVLDGAQVRTVAAGAAGSATAARVLAELRTIAHSGRIEVSTWPLAVPTIPSLLDHLSRDLPVQVVRGRGVVARVLGVRPSAAVTEPPRSAITQDAIDRLVGQGARTLLLDPAAVPTPQQSQGFAAPAVTRLPSSDQSAGPIAAVVPNDGVESLLTSDTARSNPVLAAQQAYGELAATWLEQPGIPRGLAIALPDDVADGAVVAPMLRRIAAAPFLAPATATALVQAFPPAQAPAAFVQLDDRAFSSAYAASIKHSRRLIATYESVLVHTSTEPKQLRTQLLLSEGAQFLDDQTAGEARIRSVDERVNGFLGQIEPVAASQLVTFSSKQGHIPLQIENGTGQPIHVQVQLVSPHLTVGGQAVRDIIVSQPQRAIEFDVELKTTGEFPVQVRVLAPSGRPISDTTISVRSTAYNRIALIITIGAAIALLLLWGRRFLPSRRRT